jgi:Ni/Co efflux regulator RcnB
MFSDVYDAIFLLWFWRWPEVVGQVTAVDVERIRDREGRDTLRLAVAYKFSVGNDGPYTGESFWQPLFFQKKRVLATRHNFRIGQQVPVYYRPDHLSVNKLDRRAWQNL